MITQGKTPWTPGPHVARGREIIAGSARIGKATTSDEAIARANAVLWAEAHAMAELLADYASDWSFADTEDLSERGKKTRALLARIGAP